MRYNALKLVSGLNNRTKDTSEGANLGQLHGNPKKLTKTRKQSSIKRLFNNVCSNYFARFLLISNQPPPLLPPTISIHRISDQTREISPPWSDLNNETQLGFMINDLELVENHAHVIRKTPNSQKEKSCACA